MNRPPIRRVPNRHGGALVEALVCLPIFVAALAGVLALNGVYSAKLEAKARARRLAWLQADSGECPPQSCAGNECTRAEHGIGTGGLDEALTVHDGRFSLGSFLGNVSRYILGGMTRGVGLATARIPAIVHSGVASQRGVTSLLCNTSARPIDTGGSVLEHACRTGLRDTEYAGEVCR